MWWLLQLSIVLHCVHSIRITSIRVPEVVLSGSKDAIVLDCDYVTDNVTGLVVKWFFMSKSQPVYQWIPPQKPQALGILRNKVDLSYKVSDNPYTQHRALRVLSPGTELSGNYTCVVSSFLSEDERTRPMTVFGPSTNSTEQHLVLFPEKRFDMIQDRLDDGYLNIICSVEDIFPRPELNILAGNRPLKAKTSLNLLRGLYTALVSAVVRIDSLPPTVELLCDMQVPLANYSSRKRDIFYRDPPPASSESPNSRHSQSSRDAGQTREAAPVLIVFLILSLFILSIR